MSPSVVRGAMVANFAKLLPETLRFAGEDKFPSKVSFFVDGLPNGIGLSSVRFLFGWKNLLRLWRWGDDPCFAEEFLMLE